MFLFISGFEWSLTPILDEKFLRKFILLMLANSIGVGYIDTQ